MSKTALHISSLETIHKDEWVWVIGNEELTHLAVVDENQNSLKQNIVPVFSSKENAQTYQTKYPSLATPKVIKIKTKAFLKLIDGKINFFILDNI